MSEAIFVILGRSASFQLQDQMTIRINMSEACQRLIRVFGFDPYPVLQETVPGQSRFRQNRFDAIILSSV